VRSLYLDVDGTIVNSRELVARAYAAAGVKLPENAWGRRWQDWLVDHLGGDYDRAVEVHRRKTEAYADMLLRTDLRQYALPAARVAAFWRRMCGETHVRYLTASTPQTAFSIVSRLGIGATLHGGLSYEGRLAHLRAAPAGTIYVDDNMRTLSRLTCDAPNVRLIAATGQTYQEYINEIGRLTRE